MEDVVERLKPCPFCGQKPKLLGHVGEANRTSFFAIRCVNLKCPASCVAVMDKESDKAAAKWNTRVATGYTDEF